MKVCYKILLIVIALFCLKVNAADFQKIEYKQLKDKTKITYQDGAWLTKVKTKNNDYFIKRSSEGVEKYSEFFAPTGEYLFSATTDYDFIENGRLIGYSNSNFKFYEYELFENKLSARELGAEEVQNLFPKFTIIKISEFSPTTNCLKIKKGKKNLNLIVLNDTDRYFDNYWFSTDNVNLKYYQLRGLLKIKNKGLVQLSRFGENTKIYPWFVLLIR
ncbi:hypothetical protein IJ384_05420 [bacterium]|nr:hypothetical protein [bacterium]